MYLGRWGQRSKTLYPLFDYVLSCHLGLYFIDCLCLKLLSDIWFQLKHVQSLEVTPSALTKRIKLNKPKSMCFLRPPQGTTWADLEHGSWAQLSHGRSRRSRELAEVDKLLEGEYRAAESAKRQGTLIPAPTLVSSASPGLTVKTRKVSSYFG